MATTAEARNIKTTTTAVAVENQRRRTTTRWCSCRPSHHSTALVVACPWRGGLPGGSSMPGLFFPSSGSIGSMPLFGGASSSFSGFGSMPGSPTASSVPEHTN
ncbi:MFS18 protein-like [Miscanthus floridulus]|uniref:MFS18 protein-like n=1 Tax=Miscanthus floridulus TaxID=154761 RepID=UPI003457C345